MGPLLPLLLLGCAPGTASCEAYVDAYNACAESYQGTTITSETIACEEASSDFADFYDCLAEAYENADCTTTDGWQTAASDASECEAPTD